MDSYSNFITHYVQANEAIRNATNARPQFQKYIEQCSKDHKEKLTLSDLLIMPVQRIPRYELILRVGVYVVIFTFVNNNNATFVKQKYYSKNNYLFTVIFDFNFL